MGDIDCPATQNREFMPMISMRSYNHSFVLEDRAYTEFYTDSNHDLTIFNSAPRAL